MASRLSVAAALVLLSACSLRRPPEPPPPPPLPVRTDSAARPPVIPQTPQPRPYDRVITGEVKTQTGLFKTHRIGERLYYEIPRSELDRDMLLLARAAGGSATGGSRVIRWQRDNHRVYLRQQSYQVVADTALPIHTAVAAMTVGPIIATFNIETYGPDSAAVIDVTRLFTTNVPEFAGVSNLVSDRSFLETVTVFPENIEIEATQTGSSTPPPPPGFPPISGARPVTNTVRVHWSMLKLPEQPMMPRLADKRVGYFSTALIDYGRPEHETVTRRYIHRFRLEKKDPAAEISEPVKPIVFWIDPATPAWLVPWVKAGVYEWQPAFEDAGFRNAILAREALSREAEPDWSMHDARHSIIYWRPSTVPNATGTQTVDPRSGEIIKAEVNMFHNIMSLMRSWYFIQASPLDPRARTFPFPDSLMGRLVQNVVAHEVGHALGFPHNMKASSGYPADSVRNPSFVRRMGHSPSVMDYARFNYVAQPEDAIPIETLIPRVGPYDRFAVMWGHKPIPGAKTPDDELPTLDDWARAQETQPWLRFSTEGAFNDPGNQTEAVGDADPVHSTELALKNLRRVMTYMLPATERPGHDYTLLAELYGEAVIQWGRYMDHVAALVAGADSQERFGTGTRFRPVSKQRQREAVQFLNENAFRAPDYFTDPELLRRIEAEGVIGRIRSAQALVLGSLLSEPRLVRLIEYETLAAHASEAYTVADLLQDLRTGIWSELATPSPRIDVYRRNLQRAYLETIAYHFQPAPRTSSASLIVLDFSFGPPPFTSDVRPILRGELLELQRDIRGATARTRDAITRLHLRDLDFIIGRLLDPK
jgi:hypothetical protein